MAMAQVWHCVAAVHRRPLAPATPISMRATIRASTARLLSTMLVLASLAACQANTSVTSGALPTDLSFKSVVARPPMLDTARATGAAGRVEVRGLLNQTAPCFALTSDAARDGERIVLRLVATEQPGTCATFAAGAFDYTASIPGLSAGTYDVEVRHRVLCKDGRVTEAKVGGGPIAVQ